ncbi:hypothetical protein M409DRAFT_71280 [Zasmidium cellare ATCC 36951]|uniref:Srp40 C-terminal domain-containing protein n=1 Tax=Zasmidium cellare ATCC 36951 TaxID=1080233 RepID=A0A6A6BYL0_ZASCE|nr:uncharacterized protein M409DRAFT_71280 [Zasmidium cellare ATCC 36951]KAF2159030.1 hypothetical protein M409DRAFT_71280 [Zasmidium cellare ATCC 36951]
MAFTGDLSQLWSDDEAPPPKLLDVLTQIAHFLDQLGYNKTFASLYKEAKKNDLILDIAKWERGIQAKTAFPLLDLYEEWHDANDKFPTLPGPEGEEDDAAEESSSDDSGSDDESDKDEAEGVLVDVEAEETSDDDSDEDSSSDSDDSDASPTKAGVKRKRVLTPPSSEDSDDSASDSDDSSSSEDSDAPPAKKAKVQSSSPSSDSDSESSDSSDDSSSDSDSDAGADDSTSSDSSSDSEDEKDEEPQPPASDKKKKKGGKSDKTTGSDTQAKDAGSQSSATLEGESAGEKEEESEEPNHVHPDRLRQVPAPPSKSTKKQTAAEAKKQVVPFSRIPTDQKVDPRFSSNDYVSYDYADRAYRDLSVTKGKGFTKEKNKKKRGAYRGGMIDLTPKGIKFED